MIKLELGDPGAEWQLSVAWQAGGDDVTFAIVERGVPAAGAEVSAAEVRVLLAALAMWVLPPEGAP